MQGKLDAVLKEHGAWLLSLRLIDRSELGLLTAGLAGAVVSSLAAALGPAEPPLYAGDVVHVFIGFILMAAAVAFSAGRHLNNVLFGLVILAEANLLLAVFSGWPGVGRICGGINFLGILSGIYAYIRWRQTAQKLDAVADFTGRDDFKWLVTKAPLMARVMLLSRARADIGEDDPQAGQG